MPRLSDAQWKEARKMWEGQPKLMYKDVADHFGIDNANVVRRAKKEGWAKLGNLHEIIQSAQLKADKGQTLITDNETIVSTDEAENLRATVLARHRQEWADIESYRQDSLDAMRKAKKAEEFEQWKIAKIAADTIKANMAALETKQNGEIRAWGLDYGVDLKTMSDEQLEKLVKG